jgi:hypothetical protein
MLSRTNYTVDTSLLQEALDSVNPNDFKTTINEPTGNFFYDPWQIKEEYKGTVWEKLLNTLPTSVGEARIISLAPQMSYHAHADIDDRYHLTVKSEQSYLVDLTFGKLHKLETDGVWYDMDAGRLHTASNFGRDVRIQLVVRKNLNRGMLKYPVHVKIVSNISNPDDSRFMFDNQVSPWLNNANKLGMINNFNYAPSAVDFDVEESYLTGLKWLLSDNNFRIEQ